MLKSSGFPSLFLKGIVLHFGNILAFMQKLGYMRTSMPHKASYGILFCVDLLFLVRITCADSNQHKELCLSTCNNSVHCGEEECNYTKPLYCPLMP